MRAFKLLKTTPILFINKYLEYDKFYGNCIKADKNEACLFLDENNKCTINNAKPKQCANFPYWK